MSGRIHGAFILVEHYAALYGAVALFAIIYLESFGVPLPAESALIASSLLAVRGDLPLAHFMAASFSGAVLGDSTGYVIGRYGGRPVLKRFGPHFGITPERLATIETKFHDRGALIVVTACFVVVLRQLNGLVAGTVAMPLSRFFAANCAGAVLWTLAWTLMPFYLSDLFAHGV